MRLIRQVDHPHLKLHMDVKAQSSELGTSVPELIREFARSAGHFHAQDVNLRGPGMGDIDFGPIMRALVDAHYDRWVSVEAFDFSPGAPRDCPAKRRLPASGAGRCCDAARWLSIRPGALAARREVL